MNWWQARSDGCLSKQIILLSTNELMTSKKWWLFKQTDNTAKHKWTDDKQEVMVVSANRKYC